MFVGDKGICPNRLLLASFHSEPGRLLSAGGRWELHKIMKPQEQVKSFYFGVRIFSVDKKT